MKTQLETGKETVIIELKNLGYSEQEMDAFQKTTKCPRCGCDFSAIPYSGRWLAHLSNCNGKTKKIVQKTLI
ncbi:MAG: hypothetical protein ACQCN4_12720 [Candidatus Bathyarchaeia archaeon]